MEPSARHQLHEDIQQQLAERGHYSVSYRLHGPEGVLEITELGEAFQQYGRELLRGYLMSGGQNRSRICGYRTPGSAPRCNSMSKPRTSISSTCCAHAPSRT